MFDVSFSELIVIAVVALIVIGPEKLPKVARTLGAIAGRMQRYVAQVKEEVNREVRFQELQQLQQEIQETVTKTKDSIASGLQAGVDKVSHEVEEFKLEAANPKASDEIDLVKKPNARKSRAKKAPIQE
jgi:sec-independent protein translocase protein TatB